MQNKKQWVNNAARNSKGFTRDQCVKGGRSVPVVPFDPALGVRIFPAMPNTWEKSYLCVDRILNTVVQYDVIATRNARQKIIRSNGIDLPFYNYTELFEGLRRTATMGILEE